MQQRPVDERPKIKLRWFIIYPLLAIVILTITLMVKEYKDQKVRNVDGDAYFSNVVPVIQQAMIFHA